MVIENPGDINVWLGKLGSQLQLNRDTGFHVNGSATPENLFAFHRQELNRKIVGHRNGVDVPGDDHARGAAEVGARDNRVCVTDDLEVRILAKRGFDCVGQLFFVARNRLDVADVAGEFGYVAGEI